MKAFMIIATVNSTDYITKLNAESNSAAEHAVLNLSYSGKHTYGVTACMAFDEKDMKYDTFIYNALASKAVSFDELKALIEKRNAEIREKDAAEQRIEQIEMQMKALTEELAQAREVLAS